jgi:hypothetical protein
MIFGSPNCQSHAETDFGSDQAIAGRTVIPLYRVLRTIEHMLSGDLPVPGYAGQCDRDLLLQTVEKASEKIQKLATEGIDGDGQTRRLILRLGSEVRLARAAQEYVGGGKCKEQGEKLAAILHHQRDALDKALAMVKQLSSP